MDRAENIKKYLDQEKEGKAAVSENGFVHRWQSPFHLCVWLCPRSCVPWITIPAADRLALRFCSPVQKLFLTFLGLSGSEVVVRYPLESLMKIINTADLCLLF